MALLKKNNDVNKTVSDENTAMLPDNKQSKSAIITKKTNTLLIFIAVVMLGIFVIGAFLTANRNQADLNSITKDFDLSNSEQKQTDIPYIAPTVILETKE